MTGINNIQQAIDYLESQIKDPTKGLPEDIFLFLSRITPMINVDLLIKNEQTQTLLTWRNSVYWRPGWHIPGGIIRHKETIADRIHAVAASELGVKVGPQFAPLAINEVIHPERKERGHFISLLYECTLIGTPDEKLKFQGNKPKAGEWKWHDECPKELLTVHEMYRNFL